MKHILKKPFGVARIFGLMLVTTLGLNAQTGTIQIGSGTTATFYSTPTTPIYYYHYLYSQQIVKASEYTLGGGVAGDITKIRWQFPNIGDPTTNYGDWDVWIGHTTKTEFGTNSDWVPISDMTQVFSGNIHTQPLPPTNNQWFEIEFSTPFNYNGTDNIVVAVHEKTPGYLANDMTILTYTSTPNTGIIYRSDTNNPNPATPPNATNRVATLAQLQLEGQQTSCLPPIGLSFTQTSKTSGNISWTTNGLNVETYDLEWGPIGFALGSGTQEF